MKKIDSFRDKGLRAKMVDRLVDRDIRDERVLEAMKKVPRHYFLDSAFIEFAYKDNAFPIGCDQTISNPYTVAFQSELLSPKEGALREVPSCTGLSQCSLRRLHDAFLPEAL